MSRTSLRRIDAPDFRAGGRTSVALRTDSLIRSYLLRITGNMTVTGGTGVGTIHPDAAFRLVPEVRIQAGGVAIVDTTGPTLGRLERLMEPTVTPQTVPDSLAAGAVEPFDVAIAIPLAFMHSFTPEFHALPSWALPALQLTVGFANPADLAYGNDGQLGFTNVAVELYEEVQEGSPKNARMYAPVQTITNEVPVVANVSDGKVRLEQISPIGGSKMEIRGIMVEAFDNAASDYLRTNGILNEVGFYLDNREVFEKIPAGLIQRRNAKTYGLTGTELGVYLLDAAEDKKTGQGDLWTQDRANAVPYLSYDATYPGTPSILRVTTLGVAGRIRVA